jgi:hypothetical protein
MGSDVKDDDGESKKSGAEREPDAKRQAWSTV